MIKNYIKLIAAFTVAFAIVSVILAAAIARPHAGCADLKHYHSGSVFACYEIHR